MVEIEENNTVSNEVGSEANNDEKLKRYLLYPNLGAFLLTPIWCIRNGFWISAAIAIIGYASYWPLGVAVSLVFFIMGNRWSWGNGERWDSFEQFSDSQYLMSGVSLVVLIAGLVIVYV